MTPSAAPSTDPSELPIGRRDQPAPTARREGQVVRLVAERGFGFIRDTAGKELFFHKSALIGQTIWDQIGTGDDVTFRETPTEKGPRAFDVRFAWDTDVRR